MSDVSLQIQKFLRWSLHWIPSVGVLFAAAYFWRSESVSGFDHVDVGTCLFSVLVLLTAFAMRGLIWFRLLRSVDVDVSWRAALASIFKPVLGKYVPGKVWAMLGTAYLLGRQGLPLAYGSFLFLMFQVVLTTSGLLVGLLGLLTFAPSLGISPVLPGVLLSLLLLAVVGLGFRHRKMPRRLARWYERRYGQIPSTLVFPPLGMLVLGAMLHWFVLGSAFLLFWRSLGLDPGLEPLLLQPLAINIGVLAIFVPAGLGVREGVMIGYLSLGGLSAATAAAAAIAARIWFLAAECLTFAAGVLVEQRCVPDRPSSEPRTSHDDLP